MPKKRPPNWEDIETRFVVKGEKPSDIAELYDTTAENISKRAYRNDWVQKRADLGTEAREETLDYQKKMNSLAHRAAIMALENYLAGSATKVDVAMLNVVINRVWKPEVDSSETQVIPNLEDLSEADLR